MKLKGVKLEHLDEVAKAIVESLDKKKKSRVIHLNGDLGAGKTTLVKSIARALGVAENVHSPTFVFMREYTPANRFDKIYHIDAYRFDEKDEGEILGLEELKSKNNLIIIEWPEKMNSKTSDINITIKHKSEHERDIEIKHAQDK